ncbi:MAG: glycerol-3-phosphate dehydrogenase/oxidase [Verrucomicrobiales bacterium]|nr:glycerol-3-phosphate dehydrogenase/oxidase [Verrucomicrobiales bacterium]
MNRSASLDRLSDASEEWDVIVVGGGATGLGIAVDSANRGYRTVLLEQADFSESTSSKSTKLIHGGVRYLRSGEVGLVRESLRERGRLLRNARGIVEPLSFVVPAYRFYEPFFYGMGMTLYDLLAGDLGIQSTGHLSHRETVKAVPNLKETGLYGGTLYWDGQFDDSRLAIAMARTAHLEGAVVVNRVKVHSLIKESGKTRGVVAVDEQSGEEIRLKARVVVNATGVFTDSVRKMDDPQVRDMIAPSQGIHLVLDQKFLGGESAIMIPNTDDGRVLFAIPWKNKMLLGTTDTGGVPVELSPKPFEEEVDYLIEHAGRYLTEKPCHHDIRSTFAGLRPLVLPDESAGKATSKLSRSHSLTVSDSGLITMAGGKWTTYRQMAEDTVDCFAEVGGLATKPCSTHDLTLLGNEEGESGGEQIHPSLPYTWHDIERAVKSEMATTLDDILSRRTRSLLLDVEAAREVAPKVARRVCDLLGEDDHWIDRQLNAFLKNSESYSAPTSQSASEAESEGS